MPEATIEDRFGTPERQKEASLLGMWIFLSSEVLLFAGFFTAYAEYRVAFPIPFEKAGTHLSRTLGLGLTLLLLTGSAFAALAVQAARRNRSRTVAVLLFLAALAGTGFLILHGLEYAEHAREGVLPGAWYHFAGLPGAGAQMFFTLYYLMTGLHVLHVTVGVFVLGVLAVQATRGRYSSAYDTPVEAGGLYWHFVDMVWLFLFPLFYLVK